MIDEAGTIIKNQAKCLNCMEIIESKHRHDFVWCKCGSLAVDGGQDYLKRSAKDFSQMEELSIIRPKRQLKNPKRIKKLGNTTSEYYSFKKELEKNTKD